MTQSSEQKERTAGSLAAMVREEGMVRFTDSFPRATLVKVGVIAALMLAAHVWQIQLLVSQWIAEPDWTHGFIIPLFSLYLLYSRREELMAAHRRVDRWSYAGLLLLMVCLAGEPLCVYPIRNHWLMQICMVGALFGTVLYLGGAKIIRLTWLPILFLLFALPISRSVYTRISLPLQELSAKGAVLVMKLLGVKIASKASAMELISRSGQIRHLTVAEACNGMRLLMAFLALGVAMAYLEEKPLWQRIILVAAAIPIAVLCNIIRVAITSWMYYIDKEALGRDFMHYFTGVLMLIPAFLMLWGLAWLLRHLVVEVDEDESTPDAGDKAEVAS